MVRLVAIRATLRTFLWRRPLQRCCGYLPGTQECAQGVCIREPGVQGEVLERDRGSCAFVAAPKLAELTASALEVRDSFVTSVLLPKKDGTSRGSPLRCATWPSMTGYRSWRIPPVSDVCRYMALLVGSEHLRIHLPRTRLNSG